MAGRYQVVVTSRAERALDRLPPVEARRIYAAIFALADNPRPHGCKKLEGQDSWRIRIGNYRVIYEINDRALVVTVVNVGNRRDVYR